jgi:hypothetical protein
MSGKSWRFIDADPIIVVLQYGDSGTFFFGTGFGSFFLFIGGGAAADVLVVVGGVRFWTT